MPAKRIVIHKTNRKIVLKPKEKILRKGSAERPVAKLVKKREDRLKRMESNIVAKAKKVNPRANSVLDAMKSLKMDLNKKQNAEWLVQYLSEIAVFEEKLGRVENGNLILNKEGQDFVRSEFKKTSDALKE
jgi:hypothetical protein